MPAFMGLRPDPDPAKAAEGAARSAESVVNAAVIDLFPAPVAIVVERDGVLAIEAANKPFRTAGLGIEARNSLLLTLIGDRIAAFLKSDRISDSFDWKTPESVDCRYYMVTLARRPASIEMGRCLITLIERTAELRTEQSLRREMMTDSLTGLPNRAGFADLLDDACAAQGRANFAVLAVNLDRFSRVNACMGGIVGDELLISVARRLKGALRSSDTLARTGGDEFAILMRLDDGDTDATQVATRIEQALSTPFRLSDFDIRVDCSIGIALGVDAGDESENLIRHAQFAIKRAKKSGEVEVYATRAFDIVRTQFGIETELRRAVDNGDMALNFQPIWNLASGRIVSFEALARWTGRDGRAISPVDFIPVAEESGLIVPLGRWAMGEALRTLTEWDHASGDNGDISMAVNLSAIQLQRDQVTPMVEQLLSANNVDPARLTIELTESAIIADPDRAALTLNGLKQLGTRLAMDDFGTGYSNLASLQKLPIDILKIDRSFITDMLSDRDKVAIVRAILGLAQALGMQTTAEGIESRDLEQTLTALGCTKGQGYLYSRAVPSAAALQLIRDFNH